MSVFGVDIGGLGPSSVFHSRVVFFDFDTGLSCVIFYLTLLVVIYVVITKDVTVVISFFNFGVTGKSQIIIIQLFLFTFLINRFFTLPIPDNSNLEGRLVVTLVCFQGLPSPEAYRASVVFALDRPIRRMFLQGVNTKGQLFAEHLWAPK